MRTTELVDDVVQQDDFHDDDGAFGGGGGGDDWDAQNRNSFGLRKRHRLE